MYILNECAYSWSVAVMMNLNSPYTKSVNGIIFRLKESGIITKWKKDEMDKIATVAETQKLTAVLEATSLADLTAAFMALGLGLAASMACFLLETLIGMDSKPKP